MTRPINKDRLKPILEKLVENRKINPKTAMQETALFFGRSRVNIVAYLKRCGCKPIFKDGIFYWELDSKIH